MSILTYHLESENLNQKNYLSVRFDTPRPISNKESLLSLAANANEKAALECAIKEHLRIGVKVSTSLSWERCLVPEDRSFDLLKKFGATGKLFYKNKKVIVDPFTALDFYFEAQKLDGDSAWITGHFKVGAQSGIVHDCEWVFPADPCWLLDQGIIREFKDDIPGKWVRLVMSVPKLLKGRELCTFLEQIEGEVALIWKGQESVSMPDPLPILMLTDRHGGFANLWFDYGHHGKVAFHDAGPSWRKEDVEKSWERDLLETDFIRKIVDRSHYYCSLNKVAKSLTFLLEIGWTILDSLERKVFRQKQIDIDAEIAQEKMIVKAKAHYEDHQLDLKDLVGAFNRRENFVQLSNQSVALLDRDQFENQWGDLVDQELVSEGMTIKSNHFGLLLPLLEKKASLRPDLKQQIERMSRCEPSLKIAPAENFRGTLFSYQDEGLQWLQFLFEGGFGGLLADEMGLGKTVQVLAFFSHCSLTRPSLIVVPTSLMFNWQREIEKFLPGQPIYRHEGKDRLRAQEALEKQSIILTSYALLRLDAELLQTLDYQMVILDEAQAIKNPDSQIAGICNHLKAHMRLAITGTPIENRLEDLWSIFHFLLPDLLGERRQFHSEMLAAQSDHRYLERVKKKIRPFILRRKKEEVALQLPLKLEQTVFVEMSEAERLIYERWLKGTKQGLLKKITLEGASSHRMEILEAILRLRQLCAHPWLVEKSQEESPVLLSAKFERLISDLQEVVEEKRKVLVYSQFTQMLRLIQQSIKDKGWKHVYLDGSSSDREAAVQQFQEDPETRIFLISLKAGGVGLNLTAADYVFLYDPWWNEAAEKQAIDRAHRLGKTDTVIARRYITALSIEEKIMHLKSHKVALSQTLLDSVEGVEAISLEDLIDLIS